MRLYYTGASPDNLRKARKHAPSHSHGYGWTPAKMTPHDAPYFLDHGFTDHFDPEEYHDLIDRALREHPSDPDFIVLPDVYGAAEATIQRHQDWLYGCRLPFGSGQCMRYWVLQPGLPVTEQFEAMEGCQGVFVGGPLRWKRAHASDIVRLANERDLRTHIGNPGGADGLVWAYRIGFDSADTTTVFQNQYWHYLDQLEEATEETGQPAPDETTQMTLVTDGGVDQSAQEADHWDIHCSRCGDEYPLNRENSLCESCGKSIQMSKLHEGVRCERCDGGGWIYGTWCDVERAMNGKDTRCPECHGTGRVGWNPDPEDVHPDLRWEVMARVE